MTESTSSPPNPPPTSHRPLRTWPAAVLLVLMVAARFGPQFLEGGLGVYWMIAVFGPLLCCVLLLIWWLAASRATGRERLLGFLGVLGALGVTLALADPTMRGPGTTYLTLPMGMIAFGLGALVLRQNPPVRRTAPIVFLAFAGFAFSLLLRNEGMTGDYRLDTYWRWSASAENRLMAQRSPGSETHAPAPAPGSIPNFVSEWPGFRGADRSGRWTGPAIATDWSARPPKQLWKIPVGPAWSSFSVARTRLFTQEQRGTQEYVVCYDADTGHEVWSRAVEGRFDDPLGGPGPRATPTFALDKLYVTGATGHFLCLDPRTGQIKWQQDLKSVAQRSTPMWGFSASPLAVGELVIVYAGGPGDLGLLAFEGATGKLRWSVAAGSDSYASPQLSPVLDDVIVLFLSNDGLVGIDPANGRLLLDHTWKAPSYRALQPQVVGRDVVLLPTGMNSGTRAIEVSRINGQLVNHELWTSRSLKPDFTDLVVHNGFAYGNDGGLLTCIDLKNGDRRWKGGRYGKGQILLLEKSGLLLIAAEQGQVALVRADPSAFAEVASFQALEGKTWNHPVVVGDRLYVRNAQEAAAFQLPLATGSP